MNSRSLFIAAGISGVAIGLLSGIPLLNWVNCLLCAWVWAGGILAVYMYRRNEPAALLVKPEQGALLGAIAGVIGAIISSILSAIIGAIFGAATSSMLLQMLENNPQFQDQFGNTVPTLFAQGGSLLFGLACNLVLYAIFGAIGGLIGSAIFKPKTTPPAAM